MEVSEIRKQQFELNTLQIDGELVIGQKFTMEQ